MKKAASVIQEIKYEVLKEIAYLTFNNMLEEGRDDIPYKIIPGSKARFRCCVYKEREIIRQRVRLAMGMAPKGGEDKHSKSQIVYVIEEACEGCPIHRFQVTENCQGCMAKKCQEACPFGAITIAGKRAHIDQDKCRECGRCSQACPYNAIADLMRPCKRSCPVGAISIDDEKKAVIDESKCINCGACTIECPFGAMEDISHIVDVIEELRSGKKIYAIYAPAVEGQLDDGVNMAMFRHALLDLGFSDAYEVALGADAVAVKEAQELEHFIQRGSFMTSSCCPAFVAMIQKHFPKLNENISGTVSPMVALARYIKDKEPLSKVVFIGPCMAKKMEREWEWVSGSVDYVLTFEELMAMLDAKKVRFKEEDDCYQSSIYGRSFARSGGVSEAVAEVVSKKGLPVNVIPHKCNGADECRKALMMAGAGRLMGNFIEGMVCSEGCIGGPAAIVASNKAKKVMEKNKKINIQGEILNTMDNYNFEAIDLER